MLSFYVCSASGSSSSSYPLLSLRPSQLIGIILWLFFSWLDKYSNSDNIRKGWILGWFWQHLETQIIADFRAGDVLVIPPNQNVPRWFGKHQPLWLMEAKMQPQMLRVSVTCSCAKVIARHSSVECKSN